jgi:tRNA threonylcarbamoyladenosine biosynthesis protein TsaE
MNTGTTFEIESGSSESTEKLAETIGKNCRGGEVFELISDLGGGKTAFVRGLAKGIGSEDRVSSPTFTINKQYQGTKLRIEHFDFYRLHEAGVVAAELAEFMQDDQTIVAVEWGDVVHNVLPDDRIIIKITVTGDNSRHITCTLPTEKAYILEGIR